MNVNVNIAAVILTLNEELNVVRCLNSLRWCGDLVLVDSGSNDRTVAVASEQGARTFTHVQDGAFQISKQRNWAIENTQITAPWILFLDADEVVPKKLARSLTDHCLAEPTAYNAIELTPRYLFWGRWLKRTQGYPNWHPRVVKRGEVTFLGGVWEEFDQNAKVLRLHEAYDHYANSKGLSDWLARHDRYSSWDARKIVDYLESESSDALGTTRKRLLRKLAAHFWPLRPAARFFHMYFLRFGFLEGRAAFAFCLLYFFYELMTVVKIVEIRRKEQGLPL